MLASELIKNAPEIEIEQLSTDSRMPMKNAIFFCIKGVMYDGHQYVKEAVINGANIIVYEDDIDTNLNAIFIRVSSVLDVLNQIANKFYNYPAKDIDTFVVSGCYGRTSVSKYIKSLLRNYKNTGSIGLMGVKYNKRYLLSSYSTLPILSNAQYLDAMRKDGVKACTFESNPLNLSFKKLDIVNPKVFVYTCTSLDAQDYRELGNEYYDYIRKYLYTINLDTYVVLNRDDISYQELYNCTPNTITYGTHEDSDFLIHDVTLSSNKSKFALKFNGQAVLIEVPLLSMNNVYNLVAAIVSLVAYGYDIYDVCEHVNKINIVEGVMDKVNTDRFNIVVDCAYSIDSIEKVLSYANETVKKGKKIVTVIGISFTDDERRIETILKLCEKYCDVLILTEDDSYEHDPLSILRNAAKYQGNNKLLLIEDRKSAIEEAIELLNSDDTLLIIGKGSENTIYKGLGKEYYEGDKALAIKYLNKRTEEENEAI